jgi:hypothetical protein
MRFFRSMPSLNFGAAWRSYAAKLSPRIKANFHQKREAMKKKSNLTLLVVAALAPLAGCMNMPTPTSQITGAYVSGLKYESFDCSRLSAELGSLSRRENQLAIAQEQRIKTSETQAFWYGYGQGDGIEASELANVRGEREAVRSAMDVKACKHE